MHATHPGVTFDPVTAIHNHCNTVSIEYFSCERRWFPPPALFQTIHSMKSICSLLFFAAALPGYSQHTTSLVEAELAFAQQSREENTRAAFLANLDSSGVIFNNGKVLNGVRFWQQVPARGPKLLWAPSLSHTAQAGDLGFTTGPFEVRDSIGGKILGSGQFTSVWKLDVAGRWKVLADLGTVYTPNAYPTQVLTPFQEALLPDTARVDLYQLETNLNYAAILYPQSILNREGKQPVQSARAILQELTTLPANTAFTPLAAGIARSNDLGYVYGQVKAGNKTDNYLRIWGHTAKGWVVLLQVIKL